MFEQCSYSRSHVFGLKELRSNIVHYSVGCSGTAVQVGSHDFFANGIGEGRAASESLDELPRFGFKCFIGNYPVHDVPSLESCRVILIGGVDDLARTSWSRALS